MQQPEEFARMNDAARRVLSRALEEAQRFNHNYIGTEHLLLGLMREEEGVVREVLSSMGVEVNKVRRAVEFIIGRGDRIVLGEAGLTPRSKKVIWLAEDEAKRMGRDDIGTEHLLLGLVREGEGIAAGVLESLGVQLERLRQAIYHALDLPVPEGLSSAVPPEPHAFHFSPAANWQRAMVSPLAPFAAPFHRYRPCHLDAEQRERKTVGRGANAHPLPRAPFSIVWGTLLGWVIVNTGAEFTLRLYDGFVPEEPPFAIITNPPTGACFPYHCVLKRGLTYTLEGTPGSVTIIYDEVHE
jgi:hypothetical protein